MAKGRGGRGLAGTFLRDIFRASVSRGDYPLRSCAVNGCENPVCSLACRSLPILTAAAAAAAAASPGAAARLCFITGMILLACNNVSFAKLFHAVF